MNGHAESVEFGADPESLRVGIVSTSFPVPSNLSSGIFVQRLVSHFSSRIHASVLVPCSTGELVPANGDKYSLDCFSYGPRSMLRLAHQPGGIPDALRRRDPATLLLPLFIPAMLIACFRLAGKVDVMHGNWTGPGLVAAVAARCRGRPAIVTLRGSDVARAQHSHVFRWILAACLTLNHRTVLVSERMLEDLRRAFPKLARRMTFIPNGVSVNCLEEPVEFRNPLRLVTVSNLIRSKGTETLLRALAMPECPSDVTLRIVGDGPERGTLETLASQLKIQGRIEFLGQVAPHKVSRQLEWADLFVFASESEGRPNVVLEAMAAGLPIIATDIPGIRELLLDDALLVAAGDPGGFARGIKSLLDNPVKAKAMGRRAKSTIQERGLTWSQTAEKYAVLYRTVLGRNTDLSCAD